MPQAATTLGARSSGLNELTLVFPASMPDAQRYRQQARSTGRRLLGASSLAFDPAARDYEQWAWLPYVHQADFGEALRALVHRHGVTAIYSPHQVVSDVLTELLPRVAPGVELIAADPVLNAAAGYRRDLASAEAACRAKPIALPDGRPRLPPIQRAGLIRLVNTIPGMTDLDKIDAVIEVMQLVPEGDLVEIGSWWGRSAALFLLLSQHYKIGSVLCVDPWRSDCLDQNVKVLDRSSARLDLNEALAIFQINLAPLANGKLNYLRAPSAEAAPLYRPALSVTTDTFGTTSYTGQIALLHIDGNHSYEQVAADTSAWTPHVRPGGWIIFDDYVWAFGDGPKRVADAFLEENAARVAISFVMGTALFAQMSEPC